MWGRYIIVRVSVSEGESVRHSISVWTGEMPLLLVSGMKAVSGPYETGEASTRPLAAHS